MHQKHRLPCLRLDSIILEENANTLAMMHSSDSFGKDLPDFEHFESALATQPFHLSHVLLLRDTVRYDYLVQVASVNTLNGITGEDTVRDECNNPRSTGLLEKLGRACDGVGGVG